MKIAYRKKGLNIRRFSSFHLGLVLEGYVDLLEISDQDFFLLELFQFSKDKYCISKAKSVEGYIKHHTLRKPQE